MNKIFLNKEKKAIFSYFKKAYGTPQPYLHAKNDFLWLIAVMLSAQTTDVQVNKVLKSGFDQFDTPEKMAALSYEALLAWVKTVGLAPAKARHILKTSTLLIEKYNGCIPKTYKDLVSLPGVGPKTANVVLVQVFNLPRVAVDTHVFRVAQRLELSLGTTLLNVQEDLNQLPEEIKKNLSAWLILHGRSYCRARKPLCNSCPLKELCPFYKKIFPYSVEVPL